LPHHYRSGGVPGPTAIVPIPSPTPPWPSANHALTPDHLESQDRHGGLRSLRLCSRLRCRGPSFRPLSNRGPIKVFGRPISPDSSRLAAGDSLANVTIWNAESNFPPVTCRGSSYDVDSTFTGSSGTLSAGQAIAQAPLTVTVDSTTKVYGAPLPPWLSRRTVAAPP
jgi:hypothetical protein